MSIILLLALQAAGREVTTFYPLPSKEQQQEELRKAQELPPVAPAAVTPAAPKTAKAPQPVSAPKPAPSPEPIEVVSVKEVPADANVVFQPDPQQPQQQPK